LPQFTSLPVFAQLDLGPSLVSTSKTGFICGSSYLIKRKWQENMKKEVNKRLKQQRKLRMLSMFQMLQVLVMI